MCCYRGAESKLGQFIVMVFRVLKTEENMKSEGCAGAWEK